MNSLAYSVLVVSRYNLRPGAFWMIQSWPLVRLKKCHSGNTAALFAVHSLRPEKFMSTARRVNRWVGPSNGKRVTTETGQNKVVSKGQDLDVGARHANSERPRRSKSLSRRAGTSAARRVNNNGGFILIMLQSTSALPIGSLQMRDILARSTLRVDSYVKHLHNDQSSP
jgi:hypothetical protein